MNNTTSIQAQESREDQLFLEQNLPHISRVTVIQFGPKDRSESPLNGIRIAFMNTAGGLQFRISSLDSLQRESANEYSPDIDEVIEIAMKRKTKYMQPMRIGKFVKEKPKDLCWYLCARPSDADMRNHVTSSPELALAGEIVTTLGIQN
jgi:hypothetical protein